MPQMQTWARNCMRSAKRGDPDDIARLFSLLFQPIPQGNHGDTERSYKYEIQQGPSQYDPVLQVIKVMIQDLVGKDIGVASVKYKIFPTDDAPVVWPPSEEESYMATKFYTIETGSITPMTVPITVLPRWPVCAAPTPETIHVWYNGAWKLFKDWLPALTAEYDTVGKAGWKALQRMWKANDKYFRILDLPGELRNKIYEHALGGEIYPLSTVNTAQMHDPLGRQNARLILGAAYNYKMVHGRYAAGGSLAHLIPGRLFEEPCRRAIWEPNLALFRVSQQVRDQVLYQGWAVMRKRFFHPIIFTAAVDARLGSAMRYAYLSCIELGFDNKQYFKFFGACLDRQFHINTQSCLAQYLLNLPGVKDLQLRFAHSKRAGLPAHGMECRENRI